MFGGGHYSKLEAVFNKIYKETLASMGKDSKYKPGQTTTKGFKVEVETEDQEAQQTNV